jgi:hypothetical protein
MSIHRSFLQCDEYIANLKGESILVEVLTTTSIAKDQARQCEVQIKKWCSELM